MTNHISTGFKDVVFDSQAVFRKVLKSMSEPGVVSKVDDNLSDVPKDLNLASYALALTLFDHDTNVALAKSLNHQFVKQTLAFHCSSPLTENVSEADFIVCDESEIPALSELKLGTEDYPDQSCTLIIQVNDITENTLKVGGCLLTGAGIQQQREIECSALSDSFIQQREQLQKLFPLGVDVIFSCDDEFFCLPRTTLVNKFQAEVD